MGHFKNLRKSLYNEIVQAKVRKINNNTYDTGQTCSSYKMVGEQVLWAKPQARLLLDCVIKLCVCLWAVVLSGFNLYNVILHTTECQSFSPVVRIGSPPPPHPQASVAPPPLWFRSGGGHTGTHSLGGEGEPLRTQGIV
jgi:hypothetical protein